MVTYEKAVWIVPPRIWSLDPLLSISWLVVHVDIDEQAVPVI
jgi:hypothetical protein